MEPNTPAPEEKLITKLISLDIQSKAKPAIWVLSYDSVDRTFIVVKACGKISQTIGSYRDGKFRLNIPEAFYLIEAGRAKVLNLSSHELLDLLCDEDVRLCQVFHQFVLFSEHLL